MNAAPAYKTAAMNAKRTGSPHGILITTTPGSQYKNTVNYNSGNMYYVYLYNKYITAYKYLQLTNKQENQRSVCMKV